MCQTRQVRYPALNRTALRPTSYRRLDPSDPAPWTIALIRLHGNDYLDDAIAEILSNLGPSAIAKLERLGTWDWRSVEAVMEDESGGRPFTRRQVGHYRERLGLRGRRGVCDSGSLQNLSSAKEAEYQRVNGWGFLLPCYDESEDGRFGFELRRREVDILCALRDVGAMTWSALCLAIGTRSLHARVSYLRRLRDMGLVSRTHRENPGVYSLTLLARHPDPLRQWQRVCLR